MELTADIRLVRELGRGGMGTVWLAEHRKLGEVGAGARTTTVSSATAGLALPSLATGVLEVWTKGEHTCALGHDGTLRCCGANDQGQLGDGTRAGRASPTIVAFTESTN